jgi:hypothetical protein
MLSASAQMKHILICSRSAPRWLVKAQICRSGTAGSDASRVEREELLEVAAPCILQVKAVLQVNQKKA